MNRKWILVLARAMGEQKQYSEADCRSQSNSFHRGIWSRLRAGAKAYSRAVARDASRAPSAGLVLALPCRARPKSAFFAVRLSPQMTQRDADGCEVPPMVFSSAIICVICGPSLISHSTAVRSLAAGQASFRNAFVTRKKKGDGRFDLIKGAKVFKPSRIYGQKQDHQKTAASADFSYALSGRSGGGRVGCDCIFPRSQSGQIAKSGSRPTQNRSLGDAEHCKR